MKTRMTVKGEAPYPAPSAALSAATWFVRRVCPNCDFSLVNCKVWFVAGLGYKIKAIFEIVEVRESTE